jgi:cytochrome P450
MDALSAASSPDPYPYYAELVAQRPFFRDGALWIASSAAAVTAVLESESCRVRPAAEPVARALLGTPMGELFRQMARMTDGPAHRAMKPLLLEGLGAASAARAAEECTAELAGVPLRDFVFQLAPATIARLLGLDLPEPWLPAREIARCIAPTVSPEQVERGSAAFLRLREKLAAARGGLMESLLRLTPDPEPMLANAAALFFQIYDATAGLIGNTLLAPEPSVLETLRWDPPIHNTRRFVVRDGVVCGQAVKEGDAILVSLAAANRDPAANPEPDRFDPLRENPRTFSFGAGIHACPGRTLAIEIATAGVRQRFDAPLPGFTYLPAANARVPIFK